MESKDVCSLAIEGQLTILTAAATRDRLIAALDECSDIEIDLSQVTELDSFGVQLMVAAKREAHARRKTLRFTGHCRSALALLELCELTSYSFSPPDEVAGFEELLTGAPFQPG